MNTAKDRIQFILETENLTQIEFSKTLGINQSSISRLIKGKTKINSLWALVIQEKFGYSANWILTGKGEKIQISEDYKRGYKTAIKDMKQFIKGFK